MKKIFYVIVFSVISSPFLMGCEDEAQVICMDKVWYEDKDGDGKGNSAHYIYSCKVQPEGFVSNANDANDNDPNG